MKISIRRRKQEKFTFSDKVHPTKAIIGVVVACVVLVALGILFYVSSRSGGNAGVWIGSMGVALFFLALIGFILSVMGFEQQEIYYTFPIIGILLNGFLGVFILLLYIIGL